MTFLYKLDDSMSRLDAFLTETQLIPTRSRAKRAILCGLVKVDGEIIRKPSYHVKPNSKIEIMNEIALKPAGYQKLYDIANATDFPIFNSTDLVLDLGSSAGGFLEFAAERCKKVYSIEVSEDFAPILFELGQKYPNIVIFIADAFTFDLNTMEQVNIILNDLTLIPADSIKVLSRFLPLLRKGGVIIMAVKQGKNPTEICKIYIQNIFKALGLEILQFLDIDPGKKELHLIAMKP